MQVLKRITMDLQYPLFPDNDLTLEINKILSFQPHPSVSTELVLSLKNIFKASQYPHCQSCNTQLYNQICSYCYERFYCEACTCLLRREIMDNQFEVLEAFEQINLGQQILQSSSWTLAEHLEFSALTEIQQYHGNIKESNNLLLIGKNMFSKKTSTQILQYLSLITNRNLRKKSQILDSYPSTPYLSNQTLEISFHSLRQIDEIEDNETFFRQFKNQEDGNLRNLREHTTQFSKDQRHIQHLDQLLIAETEQKLSIYENILNIHKTPLLSNKKQDSPKSSQVTEDITNTNEYMKETEQGQHTQMYKKDTRQQELLLEFQILATQNIKLNIKRQQQQINPFIIIKTKKIFHSFSSHYRRRKRSPHLLI